MRIGSLLAVSLLLVATVSSADLGPLPGRKNTSYGFSVSGLGAAPDRVVFAYPCGGSYGTPMAELVKIEDGYTVTVGTRGGSCTLYSVAKATYDAWAKDYVPSMAPTNPAADKLVAQSVKCTGAPTPTFDVGSGDSRTGINEKLKVVKLDAATCVLQSTGATAATPAATASSTTPTTKKSSCAFGVKRASSGDQIALALAALACSLLLRRSRTRLT